MNRQLALRIVLCETCGRDTRGDVGEVGARGIAWCGDCALERSIIAAIRERYTAGLLADHNRRITEMATYDISGDLRH